MSEKELNKTKKRAAATAAAVIAAAGTVLGGSFDSPADLLDDDDVFSSGPIVEYAVNDDDGADGGDDAEEARERSGRSRVRRFVKSMPVGVRAVVGVPLWCVGWLIITLVSGLWGAVLSPVLGTVLKWVLAAGIMLALLLVMLKIVFPDMPIRKIFNKKSILTALIGIAVIGVLDAALRFFLPEQKTAAELLRFFGTLTVFTLSAIPLISAEVKRRRELREKEDEADREERLRRYALELADSAAK